MVDVRNHGESASISRSQLDNRYHSCFSELHRPNRISHTSQLNPPVGFSVLQPSGLLAPFLQKPPLVVSALSARFGMQDCHSVRKGMKPFNIIAKIGPVAG